MNDRLIRQPSALIPMVMSLAAVAMIVGHVVLFGVTSPRGQDEGAAARLFQLLMAAQVPLIAYFAIRWLPRAPAQALAVLGLQLASAMVPIVTIVFVEGIAAA